MIEVKDGHVESEGAQEGLMKLERVVEGRSVSEMVVYGWGSLGRADKAGKG